MLSLARRGSKRVIQPFRRGFAQEVSSPDHTRPTIASTPSDAWRKGKVPVKEDHGLYAFFRRKADAKLKGEEAYETVESAQQEVSGRAWRASELRLKSFKDLHTLWYVTLRERNLLASQGEEARRAGITARLQAQTIMAGNCRKTMARIKAIMNERRIAYQGAAQLYAEHAEIVEDKHLLKMHRSAWDKAHTDLGNFQKHGRSHRRTRKREALEAQQAEVEASSVAEVDASIPAPEQVGATAEQTTIEAVSSTPEPTKTHEASTSTSAEETQAKPEATLPAGAEPQSAVDTAAAGLFGEAPKSDKK